MSSPSDTAPTPPDGGCRAWLVVLSSFLCNGVIFGFINTYSIIFVEFLKKIEQEGLSNPNSRASLIGSLTVGMTFLLSPLSGILVDKIGVRKTVFLGCMLAACGIFLSSLLTSQMQWLLLTYGIMLGTGISFIYTPTLAILGHYFKRYLGLVNGFVTAGSALSTIIFPYTRKVLLKTDLDFCLKTEAAVMVVLSLFTLAFKPLYRPARSKNRKLDDKKFRLSSLINVDIWRNKKFVLWTVSVSLAMFGYFVPYIHVVKYVKDNFSGSDGNLPVVCVAISAGAGKLFFGFISDYRNLDKILLQQLALLVIGVMTMLIPFITTFNIVLVIYFIMGFFDGCFVSMIGPVAFTLCGPEGAPQALGFLFGFCSIPLTVGPPIAGMIYDNTKSYTLPFVLAGIPPLVGAVMLCAIRCVDNYVPKTNDLMDEYVLDKKKLNDTQ